tara:strand:+ start:158 stop:628 length:471 start_codon:yes stop_codon:yes gene_type:complete
MNTITIILVIIIFTVLNGFKPYMKKRLIKNKTPLQFEIFYSYAFMIPIILLTIYMGFTGQLDFIEKLDTTDYTYISILSIAGLITGIIYYTVLGKSEVSYISPLLSSLAILSILFTGHFLYKKNITIYNWIGGICICIGIIILNLPFHKQKISNNK